MLQIAHDKFRPVLLDPKSIAFAVTTEQLNHIKSILDVSCSDSKFAEKAFASITLVLTAGVTRAPVVQSLVPDSAVLGTAVSLRVLGTDFNQTSQIVISGNAVTTTVVSATEVTTEIPVTTGVARDVPVMVVNDGNVVSNVMMFELTDVALRQTPNKNPQYNKEKS